MGRAREGGSWVAGSKNACKERRAMLSFKLLSRLLDLG